MSEQTKFIPQVFINADSDYGYNIVEFCNNLTDENHYKHVLDIIEFMQKYNGQEIWYTFDYSDGSSHVVHGTWNIDQMTGIISDEIITK